MTSLQKVFVKFLPTFYLIGFQDLLVQKSNQQC